MSTTIASPAVRNSSFDGPSFLIGRDLEGHWVALDIRGLGGGLFRSREAAERYAMSESDRRAGATRLTNAPLLLVL